MVNVNGQEYRLDPTLVDEIFFRGLAGDDAISLKGGPTNETAVIRVGSVRMSAPFYTVTARGVENISVTAGDGVNDRAILHDSAGNDTFIGRPKYGQLNGDGLFSKASGFDRVIAKASGDAGGAGKSSCDVSPAVNQFVFVKV